MYFIQYKFSLIAEKLEKSKQRDNWKEDARGKVIDFLTNSLEKAMNDKIFAMKPPSLILVMAKNIKDNIVDVDMPVVANFVSAIYALINMIPLGVTSREMEGLTVFVNKLIIKETLPWKNLTTELSNVPVAEKYVKILHHFVILDMLQQILQFRNNTIEEPIDKLSDTDLKLDVNEENTLRYVAGYIPYSLLKMLAERPDSPGKIALVTILHTWNKDEGGKTMSFLDYTRDWVEKVNRGGLFLVNDEFYIFIRRVENVGRKLLNRSLMVTYAGEDLRKCLLQRFAKSKLVTLAWEV